MLFRECDAFDVGHTGLEWPWIAFAAGGTHLAWVSSARTIATASLDGERLVRGAAFELPPDLELGAFSVHRDGTQVAVTGKTADGVVVMVLRAAGEPTKVLLGSIALADHEVKAIAFDRTGSRLWLSLENANETVVALLDATSLAKIGSVPSPMFPRPALHELHVHPQDDAILLLAACGEDGTFARVVGFAGNEVSAVPTDLDAGGIAAGFVGFSATGARVHLAEADELRTHAWPGLHELSSVPLADDFVSSFCGVVIGNDVLVDGEAADTNEDAVMLYDVAAIHGTILPGRGPTGMWAGLLRPNGLVTVDAKGDPSAGRLWLAIPSRTKASN